MHITVDQNLIENYERCGVICLRQVLTKKQLKILTQGIEYNLQNLSYRAKVASVKEDPGLFVEDFCTWEKNPYYKEIIFESQLPQIAAQLMGSQKVRLYHDHLLVKEPYTQQITPWHQDQPYYNIEGQQNCSMWIPIDPVSQYSTLEFLAASHKGTWYMPRTFKDSQAKWFPEGSLQEIPDIEKDRASFDIRGWEMEPGDIVCFHMLTLHSSKGVLENRRRRVFSLRFLGDDIVHAPRSWSCSPDFPDLEREIPAGAAMEHRFFPEISFPVTPSNAEGSPT